MIVYTEGENDRACSDSVRLVAMDAASVCPSNICFLLMPDLLITSNLFNNYSVFGPFCCAQEFHFYALARKKYLHNALAKN
jgi:hypothetical protein